MVIKRGIRRRWLDFITDGISLSGDSLGRGRASIFLNEYGDLSRYLWQCREYTMKDVGVEWDEK